MVVLVTILDKITTIYESLVIGDEPALAIGWLSIGKLLFFTMFLFITLGPLLDSGWIYIHHAPANFYNDTDIKAVDDLYGVFKWIPIVALSVGLVISLIIQIYSKGIDSW